MSSLAELYEERRQKCEADQAQKVIQEREEKKKEKAILRAKKKAIKQAQLNDPAKAEQAKHAEQCKRDQEGQKELKEAALQRFHSDRVAVKERHEKEKAIRHRRAEAKAQREAELLAKFETRKMGLSRPVTPEVEMPPFDSDAEQSDPDEWLNRTENDVYGYDVPPHLQGTRLGTSSPKSPIVPLNTTNGNGVQSSGHGEEMVAEQINHVATIANQAQSSHHDEMDIDDNIEELSQQFTVTADNESAQRLHQELLERSKTSDNKGDSTSSFSSSTPKKHKTDITRHQFLLSVRANRSPSSSSATLINKSQTTIQPYGHLTSPPSPNRFARRKADAALSTRIAIALTDTNLPSKSGFRASNIPNDILREVLLARSVLNRGNKEIFVYLKTRFAGRKVLEGMREGHVTNLGIEGRKRGVVEEGGKGGMDEMVVESFVSRWVGVMAGGRREGYLGGYCRL